MPKGAALVTIVTNPTFSCCEKTDKRQKICYAATPSLTNKMRILYKRCFRTIGDTLTRGPENVYHGSRLPRQRNVDVHFEARRRYLAAFTNLTKGKGGQRQEYGAWNYYA